MSSNPDVPPFTGYVETTLHALRLIHAARQGVIPRITRRLNDAERRTMIKPGAVFVFSVEESGIKRWTGAFKINGLIKKTITVTIEGSDLHLISYYTSEDIRSGRLKRPTSRPDIMALPMPPHIFRLTNFRVPPKVEIGPDGKHRLVCEGEDVESPTIECKVEEPTYRISTSSQWASDSDDAELSPRLEGSFNSGSPLYSQHNGVHESSYSRENNTDRWPTSLENLRIVPVDRQFTDSSWSPSPSPTTHSMQGLQRRGNIQQQTSGSWSAGGNLQPARWRSDSYTSSSSSGVHQIDRASRMRSNTVMDNSGPALHRRESESGHHFTRDGHPTRPTWAPRETVAIEKYSRPQSSFTSPNPPLHFGTHGYQRMSSTFGPSWTSNDNESHADNNLHPIQTQSVSSYGNSYLSSSPEGFSAVDEYGDS
ncbi:hypothetical protein H0H93_001031 [Arthromyces matolae]|nr:hypothetical protein H0H93_001031 [Arthromyces matolae]